MNPIFFITPFVIVAWIVMAVSGLILVRKGRQMTLLYRRLKNPPYPIRAEEAQKKVEEYHNNPFKTIPLVFRLSIRQQKILWARYPDPEDVELRIVTSQAKKLLLLNLIAILLLLCAIASVVIWAALHGRISWG